MKFAATGVDSVFNAVMLFVFAVLYFSVLSETAMLDINVDKLIRITKGNIYIIMGATVLAAFVGHLNGAYITTFVVSIPALAPLYKRMPWGNPVKLAVYDSTIASCCNVTGHVPCHWLHASVSSGYAFMWKRKNAAEYDGMRVSIG